MKAGTGGWEQDAAPVLFCIWLVGVVGFGIYFIYFYIQEYRLLAQALPMESDNKEQVQVLSSTVQRIVGIQHKDQMRGRLFTHDRIVSPLVWGTVKQRIVFPKKMVHMESGQMKYVLAHEMVHVRRRDNFWKLLSVVAVCIHWFNPMVWAMYFLFARDLELSCDERVIALYGSQSREEYAMTLLALAENQNQARRILFCSGFGKNPMKERIVAIMKYKKLTGIGICCAVLLIAGATTVFATNDKANVQGQAEQVELVADKELQEEQTLSYTETKTVVEAQSTLADEADDVLQEDIPADEVDKVQEEAKTVEYQATLMADIHDDGTVEYAFVDKNGNPVSIDEALEDSTVIVDGREFRVERVGKIDGPIHLEVTESR